MSVPLQDQALCELDAPALRRLDGQDFVVRDGDVWMPCRLKLLEGSRTLFVMLNGAVDRNKNPLPAFARWNWGKILGGHVLAVCDPTLYLDDRLRLGWFVGREDFDPMQVLLRTADLVARQLGIEPAHVIFYGSSGGGFAAMVAAAACEVGRAIAINPQIDITAYYPQFVEPLAEVFAVGLSPEQCRDQYPLRWSALHAVIEARHAHRDLRMLYAQNLVDKVHHARHFLPFCAKLRAPPKGGLTVDGKVLTHVYSSPEGHGAEPPELVRFVVAEGLGHLLR